MAKITPQIVIPIDSEAALKNFAKHEDVKVLFNALVKYVKDLKPVLLKLSENRASKLEKNAMDHASKVTKLVREATEKARSLSTELQEVKSSSNGKYNTLLSSLKSLQTVVNSIKVPEVTGEVVRDELESLKGDDRLDKSAIKGLQEELESFKKEAKRTPMRGMFGMRKVPIVKRINLTDQVDGVTKSFSLPRDTVEVLGVWGTQFPISFDEADFSLVGNTLTLTSQVSAPETGQTLFALVETLFY